MTTRRQRGAQPHIIITKKGCHESEISDLKVQVYLLPHVQLSFEAFPKYQQHIQDSDHLSLILLVQHSAWAYVSRIVPLTQQSPRGSNFSPKVTLKLHDFFLNARRSFGASLPSPESIDLLTIAGSVRQQQHDTSLVRQDLP